MNDKAVTLDDAIAAARALDRERVNRGPFYTSHNGEHCAAGELLIALGLPCPSYRSADSTKRVSYIKAAGTVPPDVKLFLQRVQDNADSGRKWGFAVDIAVGDMGRAADD